MSNFEVTVSFLFFFFIFSTTATRTDICSTAVCRKFEPDIRFPFRLQSQQPNQCGYPGFNLTCNRLNQTVLNLPKSGNFSVNGINYAAQELWLNDPDNCLPKRLLQLDFSDSPFMASSYDNYTFINCSSEVTKSYTSLSYLGFKRINCLSSSAYSVWATSTMVWAGFLFPSCVVIATVPVPVSLRYYEYGLPGELSDDIRVTWDEPDCIDCEVRGGKCRFKNNGNREIECSGIPRHGLTRGIRYAITIGVGIPAIMIIIGLACYVGGRIKGYGERRHHPDHDFAASISPQPTIVVMGLDGSTIESYPKLVLGDSGRIPKPNDSICSICLSEYKPKETLRIIPECKHCFHVDCIDEWLKRNATCPLCRKSPGPQLPVPAT